MSDAIRSTWGYRDPAPRVGERDADFDEPETDEEVLHEARVRYRRILDWESDFRRAFVEDVKFCNADADNRWQWGEEGERGDRPSLTINKTRQHCLMVVNDAATEHQVQGGIGWWRVNTEYEADDGFNVGLRIQRIRNAMSVWMDPDIQEVDGSDARFAFVVDDIARDEFATKYPQYKDRIPQGAWQGNVIHGGWLDEHHVRIAEYFRRSEREDTLHLMPDGSTVRESELSQAESIENVRMMSIRRRSTSQNVVEWYKIVGGTIVDRDVWTGRYIPLVRVIGEETVIDGKLERKGHTRALKDPQRMYNYWSSSAVESVALQSKTPYIAAAESIEAFQGTWDTANTENYSVLPYNALDDQGRQLPPPQRAEPPQMPQAYMQGMAVAQQEMMLASGQYQPTMGQPSPQVETSGRAIALRQRAGDRATYHYIDNLAIAVRFTGRILIDLIPKVYDTPRVMQIVGADGTVDRIQLNPQQPQALVQIQAPNAGAAPGATGIAPPTPQQALAASVTRIFNPAVGRYEVQADVGPAYATKRQQAFDAFIQVISTAPQIMGVAGDLLFRAADFPMAEQLAERLQRMVPPQALGQGPSPQEQALAQQLQGAQAHVALLSERLAVAEMRLRGKDEIRDIEAYEATTKRLTTLLNQEKTDSVHVSPLEVRAMIENVVRDVLTQGGMAPVMHQAMGDIARQNLAMMSQGPPAPTMPGGGQIALPSGLASGQMAALSPVRAPFGPQPGRA